MFGRAAVIASCEILTDLVTCCELEGIVALSRLPLQLERLERETQLIACNMSKSSRQYSPPGT